MKLGEQKIAPLLRRDERLRKLKSGDWKTWLHDLANPAPNNRRFIGWLAGLQLFVHYLARALVPNTRAKYCPAEA